MGKDMKPFLVAFDVLPLCGALAGCVTQQEGPRRGFKRIDGRRDAKSVQQYEIDKTICIGETQKSAVGMAPIYYSGLAGAINASIIENQRTSLMLMLQA
jgi:hypothetical protein